MSHVSSNSNQSITIIIYLFSFSVKCLSKEKVENLCRSMNVVLKTLKKYLATY